MDQKLNVIELKTHFGDFIRVDIKSRKLVRSSPGDSESIKLFGVYNEIHPNYIFLFSEDGKVIYVDDDPECGLILSYRILSTGSKIISLRHPMADLYLSSESVYKSNIRCNRRFYSNWEKFSEVNSSCPPDRLIIFQFIFKYLDDLPTYYSFEKFINNVSKEYFLDSFLPIARLMPKEEIKDLSRSLLSRSDILLQVREGMEGDLWINSALPDLVEWVENREGLSRRKLNETTDFLGKIDFGEEAAPPFGFVLNGFARSFIKPRYGSAVLTCIRDEGCYILEWVAWYRMLGFDHIFICSNNNSDGSDDLLGALADAGIITWIDINPQAIMNQQRKAYAYALSMLPQTLDYRWLAVVDFDEFITIDKNKFSNINSYLYLQESRGADAIALSWIMVTSDSQISYSKTPLTERCARREPKKNNAVKTIFRANMCSFAHAHDPHWNYEHIGITLNASGKIFKPTGHETGRGFIRSYSGPILENDAWVSHYFYKSFEEFVWKSSRPRGGIGDPRREKYFEPRFLADFLKFFDDQETEKYKGSHQWSINLKEEILNLEKIPNVKKINYSIHKNFSEKVAILVRSSLDVILLSDVSQDKKNKWRKLYNIWSEGLDRGT
ncbi:glycosyltransferase family 2 protein [Gluconobacter cerinus]|uniref:glycosyltransferase family 2 protein n=1 Tax=Gluconobacter cerinus TaxID=38307 RepID=UPI001B8B2415|nr:glycosyltransferase family 2 protein [Gluconobacter cerinus]MBS1019583.1 glycosyltransferase family 2 protein [Gluconobacter cerinus]